MPSSASTTWLALASAIALASIAQLLLKLATMQPPFQLALQRGPWALALAAIAEPRLLTGLLLYAASSMLWVLVLARLDLSLAYPMAAASFVIVLGLSWAALGEPIGTDRLLGAGLIMLGITVLARPEIS